MTDGENPKSEGRLASHSLALALGGILAALLVYSQTMAYHWDEGFHMVAAQLLASGKRPYLDFMFAQPPLNAFWNAAWFRALGATWRTAHVVATVETWLAVALAAGYALKRFPAPEWRRAAAIATAALFGCMMVVFDYGTIGQAYGLSLLLLVAAFRLAVTARDDAGLLRAALAGFCATAAAGASLLTAMAAPVLLFWIWRHAAQRRWGKAAAFIAGGIPPLAPVLWSLARAPRQVWFNLVEYHAVYRRAGWDGAAGNDVEVLSKPFQDTQWFVLAALAVAGWVFVRKSGWKPAVRAEYSLCLWLALAMGAQNATAHPTFEQYFVFLIPFLAVPACAGAYAIAARLQFSARPERLAWVLGVFMVIALGRGVFAERDDASWGGLAAAARKVDEVAPRGAPIVAKEQIYFLTHREPPSGLESIYAPKLDLGARKNALLHILPREERDRRIKAGEFAATVVCDDDDRVAEVDGFGVYAKKEEAGLCTVFWQLAAPAGSNP
jgi:hypothetical protein